MIVRFKIPAYVHLLLILLGTYTPALGQVAASFIKDTITISNGHTFTNSLRLRNSSNARITLKLDPGTNLNSYLPLPDTLTLQPAEQRVIPLKFLASPSLIKEEVQGFTVRYNAIEATFYTKLADPARMALQPTSPVVVLDAGSQAQASYYVSNESLIPRTVRINITCFPDGLDIMNNNQVVLLAAGAKKLLTYPLRSRLRRSKNSDFQLIARMVDDSGHIMATADLRVQTLSSSKQVYSPNALPGATSANALELNYVNMSRYLSFLQFRARGGTGLADGSRIDFKANAEYYLHPNGINIYDTWLNYSSSHFAARIGSINDNLDYSLNGNGVEATAIIDKKHSFDLIGIKNDYLLYSQLFSSIPGADVGAARYNFNTKPFSLQASVLHTNDDLLNVYDNLFHSAARIRLGEKQELKVEGGFSTEQPRDRAGNHIGYSAGINYRGETQSWAFSLNNYFSSPWYAGYRRGSLLLENEITYKLTAGQRIFGRYSKNYNSPRYTPTADSLTLDPFNYNNTNIYEAGWRGHIGQIMTTLHPYYMEQELYSALSSQRSTLRSTSDRIALDLNWSYHGMTVFSSNDLGWTKSDSANDFIQHYPSIRLLGNFFHRYWGLNWLLQWRPYYLTDQLQAPRPEDFKLYSIGPDLHFPLFANRLDFRAGYNATYYSTAGFWTHSLNSQVILGLKNNWAANAQLYYTFYHQAKQYFPDNKQIRVGIQKRFAAGRPPGTLRLRLLVFEDQNSNGELDKGEKTVEGVLLRLDGDVAVSDAKGRVEFMSLTKGNHTIAAENGKKWNLAAPLTLPVIHDQTLRIPLVESGRLNGHIIVTKQKYETVDPDKEGIRVEAKDRNGHAYTAYTDERGEFHFYLPVMDYEVSVQSPTPSSGAVAHHVAIIAGATTETEFRLEDRRRKIEVKQF